MKLIIAFLTAGGLVAAQPLQAPSPIQQSTENAARTAPGAMQAYRITVVARTTKAINYNHRGGSTKIDFRGTPLLPEARGEATVESKPGATRIDARMQKLQPATSFGPEYLTYVMWAITPDGRATNMGEVLLDGDNTRLTVSTDLQSFGLIVTAEPYFAVTQPSDVVVLENFVRRDTAGTVEQVDAKFTLLQRGQYTWKVNPAEIENRRLNSNAPLDLAEAQNAVRIARWTGAETYAPDTFQKAVQVLQNAEGYLQGKAGSKPMATAAREAVQMAEDARIITVMKIEEERQANERQASADREARANNARIAAEANAVATTRDAETGRVFAQADANRVKGENEAKVEVDQIEVNEAERNAASQIAASQDEVDRLKREKDAGAAAAQTEANRQKADSDAQMAAAQSETDRLKRANDTAQAELERSAKESAKSGTQKAELRAQLLAQFSAVLQTRDTPRGLVVNMSDVLFDTGKYSLRPLAREKLAKVAGIVSKHPGLRLDVEGYTDNVGGDDFNQRLSEQRGDAVRDCLTQEGMAAGSVMAKGFGRGQPVASNDTAQGRQQNRRVELVISGDVIGAEMGGTPIAAR